MTLRLEFVAEALGHRHTFTALCARYAISEKTGYKWLARFRRAGPAGLADQGHTPRTCPHATPARQRELLVALRRAHPTWGARTLRAVLAREYPALPWPAASTITTLLHRTALIPARRRRAAPGPAAGPRGPYAATAPNELWTIDYKGQFRTQDGRWCYPLTVVDAASRYLLACVAHPRPETAATRRVLEHCFQTYGVPTAMLSDNGPPFGAPHAPRGWSCVSYWLRSLGIQPHFTVPGHPEHNARHERLHRTLKADALRPPAASLRTQQARFDAFRAEYNTRRPHAALGLQPPAAVYHPSTQPYPVRPAPLAYPTHFHERKVTSAGLIWWQQQDIYLSLTLAGQTVGLDPVTPQTWDVYFAEYLLGTMNLTTLRFRPLTASLTSPINPV